MSEQALLQLDHQFEQPGVPEGQPMLGEAGVSEEVVATSALVAAILRDKGMDERTSSLVGAVFKYGNNGEPPNRSTVARDHGISVVTARSIVQAGIAALGGTEALQDPYVRAYYEHVQSRRLGRSPSRMKVLEAPGSMVVKPPRAARAVKREGTARVKAAESKIAEADTNGMNVATIDPVRIYLNSISKIKLLDAEQEVDLAKRIEAGLYAHEKFDLEGEHLSSQMRRDLQWLIRDGEQAGNHLMEANLRLVVNLAKRYNGRGLAFLDLIQEGNLGLRHAVEKFDYAKGYKFSTYATWWIRQGITRAIANQGRTVRLPVGIGAKVNRVTRAERGLYSKLGRKPTPGEIAEEVGGGMTGDEVREQLSYNREPASLDMETGEDGSCRLGDQIVDADQPDAVDIVTASVMADLRRDTFNEILHTLEPRERWVLQERHGFNGGEPKTLDEIGKPLGVSRERVRQIEERVLKKLRNGEHRERLRAIAGD